MQRFPGATDEIGGDRRRPAALRPGAGTARSDLCGSQRGEALASHYASGDVFVFPSLTETFGNVVLEALASGLGVVAYDQAAAAQHIRHGYNGVLAMPGDEEAFCDAARWLLEERETLRCVRLNARQHASRQGWASVIEQFEAQLRGVCQVESSLPQAVSQR
ncbi:glycosyltransferase [Pseudomonas sp. H3_A05]